MKFTVPKAPELPDLKLESIEIDPSSPQHTVPYRFRATVRNVGGADWPVLKDLVVAFRLDGNSIHVDFKAHLPKGTATLLAVGASYTTEWTPPQTIAAGEHEIVAEVDPMDKYPEVDETNNAL